MNVTEGTKIKGQTNSQQEVKPSVRPGPSKFIDITFERSEPKFEGEDPKVVLEELKIDIQETILKCFKGKEVDNIDPYWMQDLVCTVMKYHSYKMGVIPYPDEDEEDD